MRILFLDIDGVLATNRAHLVLGKPGAYGPNGILYAWAC